MEIPEVLPHWIRNVLSDPPTHASPPPAPPPQERPRSAVKRLRKISTDSIGNLKKALSRIRVPLRRPPPEPESPPWRDLPLASPASQLPWMPSNPIDFDYRPTDDEHNRRNLLRHHVQDEPGTTWQRHGATGQEVFEEFSHFMAPDSPPAAPTNLEAPSQHDEAVPLPQDTGAAAGPSGLTTEEKEELGELDPTVYMYLMDELFPEDDEEIENGAISDEGPSGLTTEEKEDDIDGISAATAGVGSHRGDRPSPAMGSRPQTPVNAAGRGGDTSGLVDPSQLSDVPPSPSLRRVSGEHNLVSARRSWEDSTAPVVPELPTTVEGLRDFFGLPPPPERKTPATPTTPPSPRASVATSSWTSPFRPYGVPLQPITEREYTTPESVATETLQASVPVEDEVPDPTSEDPRLDTGDAPALTTDEVNQGGSIVPPTPPRPNPDDSSGTPAELTQTASTLDTGAHGTAPPHTPGRGRANTVPRSAQTPNGNSSNTQSDNSSGEILSPVVARSERSSSQRDPGTSPLTQVPPGSHDALPSGSQGETTLADVLSAHLQNATGATLPPGAAAPMELGDPGVTFSAVGEAGHRGSAAATNGGRVVYSRVTGLPVIPFVPRSNPSSTTSSSAAGSDSATSLTAQPPQGVQGGPATVNGFGTAQQVPVNIDQASPELDTLTPARPTNLNPPATYTPEAQPDTSTPLAVTVAGPSTYRRPSPERRAVSDTEPQPELPHAIADQRTTGRQYQAAHRRDEEKPTRIGEHVAGPSGSRPGDSSTDRERGDMTAPDFGGTSTAAEKQAGQSHNRGGEPATRGQGRWGRFAAGLRRVLPSFTSTPRTTDKTKTKGKRRVEETLTITRTTTTTTTTTTRTRRSRTPSPRQQPAPSQGPVSPQGPVPSQGPVPVPSTAPPAEEEVEVEGYNLGPKKSLKRIVKEHQCMVA